jgi:hypothetical protein
MTTNNPILDPREQLDLLVSRIADGEAGEHDWSAFNQMAERSPEAWKILAQAQREHASMSLAVGIALHAADRVDLPTPHAAELFTARRNAPTHIRTWSRLGSYSGWAAAAAVTLLAWNGAFNLGSRRSSLATNPGTSPVQGASVVPTNWTLNTPDDAVQAYLDMGNKNGSVIGELPKRVVVNTEPTVLASGQRGVKVIFIRQFVEQTVVTDLARMSTDETGRPIPIPAAPSVPLTGPQ